MSIGLNGCSWGRPATSASCPRIGGRWSTGRPPMRCSAAPRSARSTWSMPTCGSSRRAVSRPNSQSPILTFWRATPISSSRASCEPLYAQADLTGSLGRTFFEAYKDALSETVYLAEADAASVLTAINGAAASHGTVTVAIMAHGWVDGVSLGGVGISAQHPTTSARSGSARSTAPPGNSRPATSRSPRSALQRRWPGSPTAPRCSASHSTGPSDSSPRSAWTRIWISATCSAVTRLSDGAQRGRPAAGRRPGVVS